MGLDQIVKIRAVVTVLDVQTLRCEVDTSKVPSIGLAIAILEKAVRQLKMEESNQNAVLFGQRMIKEQVDAAMTEAITNRKLQ